MILELKGNTVTQAMKSLRNALADCPDSELIVTTDNEAVKLNLYNLVHKLGYRCKTERDGQHHKLQIKLGSGRPPAAAPQTSGGPVAEKLGRTAFPVAHVSNNDKVVTRPPVRRARKMPEESLVKERIVTPKPPEPARVVKPPPVQPPPVKPLAQPVSDLAATLTDRVGSWLILQSDQIGSRDSRLGFELIEDLINHLDTRYYEGIFLVHRAVLLLDPTFQCGRGLRVLLRKNLPIRACEKSIAFYNLTDKVAKPASTAPFHQLSELARHHPLVWV